LISEREPHESSHARDQPLLGYRDRNLLPRSRTTALHATYGGYEITVGINDGVVEGRFPRRALTHVLEWLDLHRDELIANWNRARARQPLEPTAPLE